jgi:Fe-S cluster assembly ATPase SufC
MKDGHIIKTGNKDLVREIEKYGYDDEKLGTNVVEEN